MNTRILCLASIVVQAAWGLSLVAADVAPARYVLEYPQAERFCPPIAGFFEEVTRTIGRVGSRTFRHQPNGGYGLPVVDKIGDSHLLHLGADVGWHRAGEPVFAVSDGVVRISEGPPPKKDRKEDKKSRGSNPSIELAWGNLVVIEHRLGDERYVTTIYGHLANDRLVKVGDVVRAGQQIGAIGTASVNGGYKPHLHFGVREGRMAEKGRKLMDLTVNGKQTSLRIAEMREDAIVLAGAEELTDGLQLNVNGRTFDVRQRDGNVEVTPAIFSIIQPVEFAIVGYGLSTDGWRDPIAFLKEEGAEISPAPFEMVERPRKRGQNRNDE